jgi:hypothetical protein
MAGAQRPGKPVAPAPQPAAPSGDGVARATKGAQADVETARPAKHKSVEAADRSAGHDVESNADVGESGNVETGASAPRDSLESLPSAGSGDVERM